MVNGDNLEHAQVREYAVPGVLKIRDAEIAEHKLGHARAVASGDHLEHAMGKVHVFLGSLKHNHATLDYLEFAL